VCAYEHDEKCNQIALKGAIPLSQFEWQAALPKEREVIFFCA
jgi:hypothetical protein